MKQNNNYKFLADKWTKRHQNLSKKVSVNHKKSYEWLTNNSKQLAVGSLSGLMLLTTPISGQIDISPKVTNASSPIVNSKTFLVTNLTGLIPEDVRPLTDEEEKNIGDLLTKSYGIKTSASLNNLKLNRSYGLIGAEQHLARYPGDNMSSHFDGNNNDSSKYFSSGMAPGLGAWGYFSTSKSSLTDKDTQREKYYIATQTFLAQDYNKRVAEYRDFFKHRKMLIVNPHNGKAVVAVISDAGPAQWTGKHLGGSPEVMKHLERVDGSARGPVLYFFIDDPDDTISLGPINPI